MRLTVPQMALRAGCSAALAACLPADSTRSGTRRTPRSRLARLVAARDFDPEFAVRKGKDLTFAVRRLDATRIARIRLKAPATAQRKRGPQ